MDTLNSFQPDHTATICAGPAYVRLIEAAAVLIAWEEVERSRRRLEMFRRRCQEALRLLVDRLPPHVTAQIMAVNEKAGGRRIWRRRSSISRGAGARFSSLRWKSSANARYNTQ